MSYEGTIARHLPELRCYARHLTRNDSEADDVVQDALIRAWRYWPSCDEVRARQWLFRIVRNVYFNRWHTAKQEVARRPQVAPPVGDLRDEVVRLDDDRALESLVAELDPVRREVLLRYHVRGETYAEIAAAMGTPIGTVMSRLARARKDARGLFDRSAVGSAGVDAAQVRHQRGGARLDTVDGVAERVSRRDPCAA